MKIVLERILLMAWSLTALGARAQATVDGLAPFPPKPTLVFPAFALPGAEPRSEDAQQFGATALRDLKESGAFHVMSPARPPAVADAPAAKGGRLAGADLMFRFVSHSLAQGKLLVEGECINVATGAVVLKKNFMGQTAAVDRMAHRMVDFLVGKVTGTPGVADSTIVFARATAPGIQELFGVDRDGRNLRQLTSFGSLTLHPAVAGDGRLAFVTYKGGPPQIWGQLQPGAPYQLLYPKQGQAGMELSGLAWAPDGQRLAFVQETRKGLADIHVLELRSGRDVRLTEGHTSQEPSWSPDGTRLACLSDREGASQVFILAGDGSHAEQLTRDPAPKGRVAWSLKSDRISYSARVDGRSCLFTLAPDGSDRQQVWSGPEPVASLCWAPDGRSLLLGLAAGAGTRLRIAGLDGKIQELGANLDGGQSPQWVQNAAPRAPARPLTDRFTAYPVPAILGASPLH